MGHRRGETRQTQVDRNRKRLGLIGPIAGLAVHRYGALPLQRLRDVLCLWPALELYCALVSRYRETTRGLAMFQEITRRVRGAGEAEGFSMTWKPQAERASRELTAFGSLLCFAAGLWAWDHLRTASDPDAPLSERNFSRDKVLHATRTFHEALREFRHRLRKDEEDEDPGALFQAWATVGPAIEGGSRAFIDRVRRGIGTQGFEQVLFELPFVSLGAVMRHAQSELRAAYVAAAPHRRAPSVTSLRPSQPADDDEIDDDEFLQSIAGDRASVPDFADAVVTKVFLEMEEDTLRRRLRLDLTEKQHTAVMEYWQARSQGHTLSGKLGQSLRQYWGENYDARRRMLHRVRCLHPELLHAIESFADDRPRRRSR